MGFTNQVLKVVNTVDNLEAKFDDGKLIVECTEDQAQNISRKLTTIFDLSHLKCNRDGNHYSFNFT